MCHSFHVMAGLGPIGVRLSDELRKFCPGMCHSFHVMAGLGPIGVRLSDELRKFCPGMCHSFHVMAGLGPATHDFDGQYRQSRRKWTALRVSLQWSENTQDY